MTAILVFLLTFLGPGAHAGNPAQTDYPVKGKIDKSVQVAAGATVYVRGIEGPLTVETGDVASAEIHWTREALTQKDYDCETIDINEQPSALTITHRTDRSCQIIQARETLKLVLPRSASIVADGIEGSVTIGETEGILSLKGIEGAVRVERLRSGQLRGIEGGIFLGIDQLAPEGLEISGVEGAVNITVSSNINADVQVVGVRNVTLPVIDMSTVGLGRNSTRSARLGAGGPMIVIKGIEGSVTVSRK